MKYALPLAFCAAFLLLVGTAAATSCVEITPDKKSISFNLGYSETQEQTLTITLSPYTGTYPFECGVRLSLKDATEPWLSIEFIPPEDSVGGIGIDKSFKVRAQTQNAPFVGTISNTIILTDTGDPSNTRSIPITLNIQGVPTPTPIVTPTPTPALIARGAAPTAPPAATPLIQTGPIPFLSQAPPMVVLVVVLVLIGLGIMIGFFVFGRGRGNLE